MIRYSGQGPHLAMTGEPRGFSRVAEGFSSYDGDFRLPLVLGHLDSLKSIEVLGRLFLEITNAGALSENIAQPAQALETSAEETQLSTWL